MCLSVLSAPQVATTAAALNTFIMCQHLTPWQHRQLRTNCPKSSDVSPGPARLIITNRLQLGRKLGNRKYFKMENAAFPEVKMTCVLGLVTEDIKYHNLSINIKSKSKGKQQGSHIHLCLPGSGRGQARSSLQKGSTGTSNGGGITITRSINC